MAQKNKNSQISPIKRNVNIQGKHLDDWKKKKRNKYQRM